MDEFTKSITTLVPKKVKNISCFDHIRPIPFVMLTRRYSLQFSATVKNHHEHVLLLDLLMKRFPNHFSLWVDFSKAFDSIAHNYQASTRILINDSVSDIKIPVKRGSRQGDPISGYLT
eukprot:TRINITY_DN1299_c0_g2_i1.p2 TRINITY_DN1299_c0_g2~~TRINITY_DN1299_c0_g2_i1.p2  ORF type:complete len:118 (+),score=11.74 TRINITY_DN1299_c0_g2_i1:1977-2330(+)